MEGVELVANRLDEAGRKDYGQAVLNCAKMNLSQAKNVVDGMAFSQKNSILKERLVIIMKHNRKTHLILFTILMAVLIVIPMVMEMKTEEPVQMKAVEPAAAENMTTAATEKKEEQFQVDETEDIIVVAVPENLLFQGQTYYLNGTAKDTFQSVLKRGRNGDGWYLYQADVSIPDENQDAWYEATGKAGQYYSLFAGESIQDDKLMYILRKQSSDGFCKFTFKKA